MRKLIMILLVFLSGMVPSPAADVMAQSLPPEVQIFPTGLRVEGLLHRSAPESPGAIIRSARPYSPNHVVDFESNDGSWTVIRTLSFSGGNWQQRGMMNNLTTSVSVGQDTPISAVTKDKLSAPTNKDRFVAAPSGLKIGYGLTYYLPISQSFSGYAQLKPPSLKSLLMFKNVFTAPQTMLATGFQLPIITASSPTEHSVLLKFSAAADQKFRPIMSFTINLLPSRR
jgi:hypothetical protein